MKTDCIQRISCHSLLAGLFTMLFFLPLSAQENQSSFKVISANIRVALSTDTDKGYGWDSRKDLLFDILKAHKPDILCLQEVLEIQNSDFKTAFPGFTVIGFEGPEMDAHTDGEYHGIAKNPIVFSNTRFELLGAGQYWLSDTPYIGGSMAWGTARARNLNWVRLKDKTTGKIFRVANVHLDHISDQAREKQTEMILEECAQYPNDFPQLLAGDFNSDASSTPIRNIKTTWTDSYTQQHGDGDPGFTVHGFKGPEAKTKKGKVDFIFYKGPVKAISAAVIKDSRNGVYPSDHYFVSAELIFQDK